MWTEEEAEGVREEMLWETDRGGMEGDQILQAEPGHHGVMGWALKQWKNSLEKTHL